MPSHPNKVLIYQLPADPALYIVVPLLSADDPPGTTFADVLQRARKDVPAAAVNVRVADRSEFPADRAWREAWADGGTTINVDLPRARLVRKRQLLARRDERLARLDVLMRQAQDAGDTVAQADYRTKRLNLRALNGTIDADLAAVTTPDGLAAYQPAAITAVTGL